MGQAFITRRGSVGEPVDEYRTISLEDTPLIARLSGTTVSLKTARSGLASASTSTQAVFAGGVNSSGYSTNVVDAIDSELFRRNPSNLTNARFNLAGDQVNGRSIFAGGESGGVSFSKVDAYSLTFTHTNPADLTVPRTRLSATTVGSYVLFAGGRDYASNVKGHVDAYTYDTTRSTATALIISRENLSAATISEFALAIGGRNSSGNVTNTIDVHDTSLGRKTILGLSSTREGACAVSTSNHVFIAGGKDTLGEPISSIEVFDKDLVKVTTALSLSSPCEQMCGFEFNGNVCICGGKSHDEYYSIIETFDPNLVRHNYLALSVPRSASATAKIGGYALVGGGEGSSGSVSTVDAFKAFTDIVVPPGTIYKLGDMANEETANSMLNIPVTSPITGYVKIKNTEIY